MNIHVYRSELLSGNMAVLNVFLALTALFLSATGLFTLISINIQKRTKEIGLRRIMGASISQIVGLVNKGFIWVVLISVTFGTVLGSYLTEMFLDLMYSIHSHAGLLAIGLTTGLVILIVTLTSGFKVFKAADSPPVEALKYE
jgi:putative ABC transport system permease protein